MDVPPSYRIVWSGRDRETVEALSKKAEARGLMPEFIKNVEYMTTQLATSPTWGDPYVHLKHMDLVMYHGLSGLVHVHYGVDEERCLVYIKDILPLPGLGLE
jgi:hypothetical protein